MPYLFDAQDPQGQESYKFSIGEAAGLGFASSWENSGGPQLWRGLKSAFIDPVRPNYLFRDQLKIEQASLNEKYGIKDVWNVPIGMSERAAIETRAVKMRQIEAQSAMDQAGIGTAGQIGIGFAGSLLDPLNLAFQYTPLPWLNRFHAAEQSLSLSTRIAARIGIGGLEGAAGAAAFEPVSYMLNRAEGNDYTFQDSLVNVMFSAGAGMLLRPIGMALGDKLGKPHNANALDAIDMGLDPQEAFDISSIPREQLPKDFSAKIPKVENTPDFDPIPNVVKEFDVNTRLEAMGTAISQVADGETINVEPVFNRTRIAEIKQLEDFAQNKINYKPIKEGVAIAPDNSELPIKYAIVEASDLIPSHNLDGMENPDYPKLLQPRDRGQASSQLQINDIAAKLNPTRLGETFDAQNGAPIVGSDGLVESGNGRALAILKAYTENSDKSFLYRDYLQNQGYDIKDFEQPVLVRISDAERDAKSRVEFAQSANGKAIGSYNAAEQAVIDANKINMDDLSIFDSGDLTKASNANFNQNIIKRIANINEYGELIDNKTKRISQVGLDRIKAALVQKAYGDQSIVRDIFTSTDNELRGIGDALAKVAPKWAIMRQMALDGRISAMADVTDNVKAAVNITKIARGNGKTIGEWISNADMFDEIMPATRDILHLFFGEKLNRQISSAKIHDALDFIAEQAMMADPTPDIFGEVNNVKAEQLSGQARSKFNKGDELSNAAASNNGRGNGENGANGNGQQGKTIPIEPSQGTTGVKPKGVAKLLEGVSDPELNLLRKQSSEIDDMLDNLSQQGAIKTDAAQKIKEIDKNMDDVADLLSAASYCLAKTTGGNLL